MHHTSPTVLYASGMRYLPALLLLLGCVTTHHELRQAAAAPAYRPPPVAYTSPPAQPYAPRGAGAPLVGQPGAPAPVVPRSPNKRPLPATREPGLWAADGAKASTELEERKLLGTYLPGLKGVVDSDGFAKRCAAEMTRALAGLPPRMMEEVEEGEMDASFAQLPCLAAWLYQICAERHLPTRLFEPGMNVPLALDDAREMARLRCNKHGDTLAVRVVLAAVRRSRSHLH